MSTISSNIRLSENQIDFEPEVELISLISETLPHYKLRADYSVRFSGYQHSDFNRAEQVKDEISELTNEQIHQTLEYFILCGLRVNKMTETYEDCQALTLLVQEQRSHLDLAANIGLNLVEKNTQLEQRVISLEEQLESSKDTMKQMRHQLTLKDDLLRMFHSEMEEDADHDIGLGESSETVFLWDKVSVKRLETKLSRLEEENLKLRDQQQTITSSTDLLETKETQLVNDCVTHILESTKTIDRLSVELNKKTNEYLNQHEEISRLLTSKIDLENKTHHLLTENDNLITQLRDHQTKEFTLTKELADMRDRYDECINLLNEKQDEIRVLKRRIERMVMKQVQCYQGPSESDMCRSLASEMQESCRRDADDMDHSRTMRIMEQARSMNTTMVVDGDDETSSGFTEDMASGVVMNEPISPDLMTGNFLLRRSIQEDCERRRVLRRHGVGTRRSSVVTPHSPSVMPDSPYLSQAMFHHQSNFNGLSSLNTNLVSRTDSPMEPHNAYKLPDKLQLIKPIEGSQTLRAWQNLATPSLTKALFEAQPHGVCYRGQQFTTASSLSSPNSDSSRDHDEPRTRTTSDCDEVDYEEPAPVVKDKMPPSHCHSRLDNVMTCPGVRPVVRHLDGLSCYQDIERRSSHSSSDARECTPVNDVALDGPLTTTHTHLTAYSSSTWLDRFTVGSIMTSILGYSRPISTATFTSASNGHGSQVSWSTPPITATSTTTNDSSIIDRLTTLPPLARRKPMQRMQSGLNLLTSLAPCSSVKMALHRVDSTETDGVD